ncbi:hypothetical protein, partial [Streptomyces sp. SID3343]|uniref:hypothetical protein n=1 Tax=Streptomyces sp. SID3343 TaxID=2690260 RepID=UPI001F353EFF
MDTPDVRFRPGSAEDTHDHTRPRPAAARSAASRTVGAQSAAARSVVTRPVVAAAVEPRLQTVP